MFLNLFYGLREEGVSVSIQEWQMFTTALERGLHRCELLGFYHLARSCLIKSETYFDAFDRVFAHIFHDVDRELSPTRELMDWLNGPKKFEGLTKEQRAALESLDADELMKKFFERLEEQQERHDGGGKWIGTGGHSPFGHSGAHSTGIRVGGRSLSRSAMKVAENRRFKDYRTDLTLDLRNLKLTLRRLRQLTRSGPEELDLDGSIDETCRNAGEIEIIYRPEKRNDVRLVLFMDVGGTMDPYYEPVSRLLTALHEERSLRDFKTYYFHNCVYERVGTSADLSMNNTVPTGDVLRKLNERWKVLFVGDAAMHPGELMSPRGNINPRYTTDTRGMDWLMRIENHFDRSAWLNPDPVSHWKLTQTTRVIQSLFAMFPLTTDGIQDAVTALVDGRPVKPGGQT